MSSARLAVAITFVAALIAVLIGMRCARWLGLVDEPGAHKRHQGAVPVIGGLAIALAAMPGFALLGFDTLPPAFWCGFVLLLAVGAIDDRRGLSTAPRFAAQILAALLMVWWGGVRLADFGELLWPGHVATLGFASTAVTVFCVVGVINAINMADGLDGHSGSLLLAAMACVSALAWVAGRGDLTAPIAVWSAATLGFVLFNARWLLSRARVFLGDAGSLAMGFALAWFLVAYAQAPTRVFAPVTALWVLMLPLVDTVSVMWRRLSLRLSPFRADHRHIHHLLLRAGHSVRATQLILLGAALVCALSGMTLEWLGVPESVRFALFLLLAFGYHVAATRWQRRLPELGRVT
jgi:UDP-GlcNAc:undecaprenyl-phosphate GlcNAc-1-phosphate transferase